MARIDYQTLLDNALKSVVKDALVHAQFNGLGDGTHFFITFRTRDAGVVLPDFLRIRYPDIMTIVLQLFTIILQPRPMPAIMRQPGKCWKQACRFSRMTVL